MRTLTIRQTDVHTAQLEGVGEEYAEGLQLLEWGLGYYPKGFEREWAVKRGLRSGRVVLVTKDGVFPGGLADRAVGLLEEAGWGVAWRDDVVYPSAVRGRYGWVDKPPLRDYQAEAVEACLRGLRGIVWMATGAGKTLVAAAVIGRLGLRSLVIVPGKDLLRQTAEVLHQQLPKARLGMIGDGYATWGEVTIATFQSLSRNLEDIRDELARVQVVISDEAQHSSAETWQSVLGACGAPYRFAFSATPFTNEEQYVNRRRVTVGHDLLVEAQTGPVISRYSAQDAVEDGHLVPPEVWIIDPPLSSDTKAALDALPSTNWQAIYQTGIIDNDPRNTALVNIAAGLAVEWGQTLVLARSVAHGEALTHGLLVRKVKAVYLSGETPLAARTRAIARLEKGELQAIVATTIFDEGVDVPAVSAVVLAGGGKADHKGMQRIGRGMRKGGREAVVVVDCDDRGHFVLANHSKRRAELYAREGWTVIRQ